ncbi:hypothetical protein BN961_01500 [Afipia felis]|uniref:Uncharacterized protein n=1 Tax=Afipia felis TaxID=1035 RepID=A0A090MKZ7_AFIFE|nr:hypothetical protein BN961_01500 [Afipia felis]
MRPGTKCWQATLFHLDRDVTRQGSVRNFGQRRNGERVRLAELRLPFRLEPFEAFNQGCAAFQLDDMALAVVEAERLDAREAG